MESMCGVAVGNYGAAVGNQAQLVGKCGPLPRAGWTETERKRPTVRGLRGGPYPLKFRLVNKW